VSLNDQSFFVFLFHSTFYELFVMVVLSDLNPFNQGVINKGKSQRFESNLQWFNSQVTSGRRVG